MHQVFQQRRNQEQQHPGAERAPNEKPIQRNAGTGQQAFQHAGQVIGDGVGGEPDAHHDRGETHRCDLADQGKADRRQGKLLHFRKRRRAGVKRDSEVPDTQFFAWLLELAAFSRLFVGRKVAGCIV